MTIAAGSDITAADGINIVHGVFACAASTTGNDTYAITLTPAPTAYANYQIFRFKPDTANTGAATLNVNGLGAKTIKKNVSSDLETGDILANQIVEVVYDGTNFQLLGFPAGVQPNTIHKNGTATLSDPSTGTVGQNIAHGLGKIPKKVKVTAIDLQGSAIVYSFGVYNGTTTSTVYFYNGSSAGVSTDSSNIVYIQNVNPNQAHTIASITFDATNLIFSISGDATWGSCGSIQIMWEAEV